MSRRAARARARANGMELWQAALFGVVQGLTEFLPISSDGHLALLQHLFGAGNPESDLAFTVWVHAASLLAMLYFFRGQLWEMVKGVLGAPRDSWIQWSADPRVRLALLVALSTAVTALGGIWLEQVETMIHRMASSLLAVGAAFVVMGGILSLSRLAPAESRIASTAQIPWSHAVWLGLAQLAAVLPAISRSGSTITLALLLSWSRPLAFEYSFLMAIPAIGLVTLLKAKDLFGAEAATKLSTEALAVSFVFSLVVSFAALALLSLLVRRGRFYAFAYYLLPLGAVCVAVALARG